MKHVYDAANSLEAHMVLDLLRQQGIHGQVEGEYLQGAMGALPATGLVRVVVDEADHAAAERVITHWNQAQPAEPVRPPARPGPRGVPGGWLLLAGVVLGVGLCQAYLHPAPGGGDTEAAALACRPA